MHIYINIRAYYTSTGWYVLAYSYCEVKFSNYFKAKCILTSVMLYLNV